MSARGPRRRTSRDAAATSRPTAPRASTGRRSSAAAAADRATRPSARRPPPPDGLDLVPVRTIVETGLDAVLRLRPGDRPRVAAGERFEAGAILAEILRDGATEEVAMRDVALHADDPRPGDHWPSADDVAERRRGTPPAGELLYELYGRWRLATGEVVDAVAAPAPGSVREVVPGAAIRIRLEARAVRGAVGLGAPVRGRLEIATAARGEVRASAIDVERAGTILVVGARVDAETLTRARAMGVRGIVVGGLASKEQRDFLASERRQQAGRHRVEPFAVLVLDGALRRPIASPILDVLRALAGREVGLVVDPPALLVDDPEVVLPAPGADLVRVRSGPGRGTEGRWLGPAGLRRFAGGIHLDAGRLARADGTTLTVPVADLERFA